MFPDHKKTTSLKFLRKLRIESQRSCKYSTTEDGNLGAQSRLDDCLLDPLIQGDSGTAPETSRNAYGTNQGTNEDDSKSDHHPEATISQGQMTRNSGSEDGHDRFAPFQELHFLYCCELDLMTSKVRYIFFFAALNAFAVELQEWQGAS